MKPQHSPHGATATLDRRAFLRVAAGAGAGAAAIAVVPAGAVSAISARKPDAVADAAVKAVAVLEASTPEDSAYVELRHTIAVALAHRLDIDAVALEHAIANADAEHQLALMAAFTQLGVRYRRNMSRAGYGFDCSGLTFYAWKNAGVTLQRQSRAQINAASARTLASAQAGDLLYYPGHVMLWLGVGRAMVHSPRPGRRVEVSTARARRKLRVADPTA